MPKQQLLREAIWFCDGVLLLVLSSAMSNIARTSKQAITSSFEEYQQLLEMGCQELKGTSKKHRISMLFSLYALSSQSFKIKNFHNNFTCVPDKSGYFQNEIFKEKQHTKLTNFSRSYTLGSQTSTVFLVDQNNQKTILSYALHFQ